MMEFDTGYQQPTVFDRLWYQAQRTWRKQAARRGPALWGGGFLAVAVLFHAVGALFLYSAIFPDNGTSGARWSQLASALLAFGVARHFTACAIPLLKEIHQRLTELACTPARAADHAVVAVAALVVLPLTLYAAQSAHPLAALLLLIGYGLAGRQLWRQARVRVGGSRPAVAVRDQVAPTPAPVLVEVRAPAPGLSPRERRAYLDNLRAAGVNVRIARALVSAGFHDTSAVRRASDEEILAVRGVGPATLQKIRVCFPG